MFDRMELIMMAEVVSVTEAVKRLEQKYTGAYLVRLAKQGKIEGRQSGNIWLLDWQSVQAYAQADHPRGGSVKGWKKGQQRKAEASAHQPEEQRPPTPAVQGSKPAQAIQQPPAPQETIIDREGAHITIDPLQPDRHRWMHAEATKGDVTAWADIRPYADARWPGGYTVDYYYDRKDRNKKGAMGRNQEERAQALMHLLRDQLTEALQAQGWQTLTKTPSGQTLWHYRPGQQKEAQP
jgi:hypothetical protein